MTLSSSPTRRERHDCAELSPGSSPAPRSVGWRGHPTEHRSRRREAFGRLRDPRFVDTSPSFRIDGVPYQDQGESCRPQGPDLTHERGDGIVHACDGLRRDRRADVRAGYEGHICRRRGNFVSVVRVRCPRARDEIRVPAGSVHCGLRRVRSHRYRCCRGVSTMREMGVASRVRRGAVVRDVACRDRADVSQSVANCGRS